MNVKKFTIGVAVLLCSSSAVLAQNMNYSPNWYLAPSLNIMNPDDQFGVDDKEIGAGIRMGKALSPNWDMQFGTTYVRTRDNGVRYQQNLLGADALYMFSRDSFRPFVLVGAGAEFDKRGATSETSPYVNAGVGFQYAFNPNLALQADYRRVHGFLRDNSFGFKRSDNDYLNLGMNFTFGAK